MSRLDMIGIVRKIGGLFRTEVKLSSLQAVEFSRSSELPTSELPPLTRSEVADRLLVRVAGGDREAFNELYDQVCNRVFGLCMVLLKERQQAEEVAQETLLQVWQRAGSFDPTRGTAISWVLRSARSKAIDRIRHSQASRLRDAQYAHADHRAETDIVIEDVLRREESAAVLTALDLLSAKQREAVALSYYGVLSSQEISEELGVPVSTVKTRIRDGLIQLGAHLTSLGLGHLPVAQHAGPG